MKEKFTHHFQQTSLTIVLSEIQAIRRKNTTRTACRVYKDGKIGIAGSIGKADIYELYAKAEQNLEYQIDYPVEPTKNVKSHCKIDTCKITDGELCNDVEKILKELTRLHPDFTVSHKVNLNQVEVTMENELGLDLSFSDRNINIAMLLRQKGSSDIMNTIFGDITRNIEPEKVIKASSELISAYTNMLPFPKESLPLILQDNIVTPIFERDLSAKLMGTGSSLFQHQLGKEVFAKDFSLKIENNPIETFAPPFDMEGVITPESVSYLVKDGVILRPYSDKRTSMMYGYENTGCGEGGYDSVPTLGAAGVKIQPGKKTIKELLNGQMGILVMLAGGGDFTPDGKYASPVQLAYLTDGEKLIGRLPEFTIKSSIYDIFGKNFIGMSSDRLYTNNNDRMLVTKMDIEQL